MKRFLVKYKFFVVVVILFCIASSAFSGIVNIQASKANGITIVLDAGHGGLDVK